MSYNQTKSDNERLYPALPIQRIDENHELDEEVAAATNGNFEVPPDLEYVRPVAGETAEINGSQSRIRSPNLSQVPTLFTSIKVLLLQQKQRGRRGGGLGLFEQLRLCNFVRPNHCREYATDAGDL